MTAPRTLRRFQHWPEVISIGSGIACMVAAWVIGPSVAKAAEAERCQIYVKPVGEVDWRPYSTKGRPAWTFTSCSACSTDIGGQSKLQPDGTWLTCVDVTKLVRR